jgi:uncharacterized membrane protein YfcA
MSFREKSAWVTLVAILLVCVLYFSHGPDMFVPRPHPLAFHATVGAFIIFVVIKVVAQVVLYFRYPQEARTPKDERERLIDLKATRIAAYIYLAGTFLAVLSLHHGAGGGTVGYFVLLSFVIAEVANQAARIAYHRRGF